MVSFNRRFTFDLPYNIRITEGQVTEDIVIPLVDLAGRIIIHPPRTHEKRYVYESPEKSIWEADTIEMDVEIGANSSVSLDDLETISESLGEEYLKRLLRYCRSESKQPQIDLKQEPDWHVTYIDDRGLEVKEGYIHLSLPLGGQASLDDLSWNMVSQCLSKHIQIPFHEEALLDAKLYRSYSDYRMAIVTAVMGIESILKNYLRARLKKQLGFEGKKTPKFINDFVRDISNRFLIKTMLPLFLSINQDTIDGCWKSIELRHAIVHNEKRSLSVSQANEAIHSL